MKKYLFALLIIISFSSAKAQDSDSAASVRKERLKFEDLPGNFTFDIGLTHYRFAPRSMDLRLIQSRGININYNYDIKLVKNFSFAPGLGVSVNNYGFKKAITIKDVGKVDSVDDISKDYPNLKRTKLNVTYIDIPLEFRWKSNPDINSFRITLGFKAGILASAHTKIRYKDDGAKVIKKKEDFNLEKFRYGIYGRVGYGVVSLFGYYSLSEMFQSGKAPGARSIVPYTIGISIAAF
jgi:hypothetical protein